MAHFKNIVICVAILSLASMTNTKLGKVKVFNDGCNATNKHVEHRTHHGNYKETNKQNTSKTGDTHQYKTEKKSCRHEFFNDDKTLPQNLKYAQLNDAYSNLVEKAVSMSLDEFEVDGVSLYELVSSECGGAVVCPHLTNWTDEKTLTIGFLGAYGRSQTVLGALPLVVSAVNREPALLPGRRVRYVAADIGTRPPADRDTTALRVMTQMRDLGVVAFFGPDDTCQTEAKLAAAWNLPLISHKCAGAHGSEDTGEMGATFARTLPPASKVSKSVVALLRAFRWDKFALVAGDERTAAAQQLDAIKELAHGQGMTVTAEHRFADYIPRHIADMERIVDQTYDKTRVYVFLGEHIALVDFVTVLQRRGLMRGEYAVVAVDDEIYDPSSAAIIQADHLGQNNSVVVEAFRMVLKLTPSYPTNPHYSALCQMIRKLSAAPPFCVPNYHKILFDDASVPIEAAHLFDAVALWARAATAAMRAGLPPTDGTSLMHLLRPTTYRSVQGFDVHMDATGDAEGNFTVVSLVADPTSSDGWSAQPVATFTYTNCSKVLPDLVGGDKIAWINGKPPVAEPVCGFDDTKCSLPHDPENNKTGRGIGLAKIGAYPVMYLKFNK